MEKINKNLLALFNNMMGAGLNTTTGVENLARLTVRIIDGIDVDVDKINVANSPQRDTIENSQVGTWQLCSFKLNNGSKIELNQLSEEIEERIVEESIKTLNEIYKNNKNIELYQVPNSISVIAEGTSEPRISVMARLFSEKN